VGERGLNERLTPLDRLVYLLKGRTVLVETLNAGSWAGDGEPKAAPRGLSPVTEATLKDTDPSVAGG